MRDEATPTLLEGRAGTRFLLVLAAYFLLQVVLRISSPAALKLDEAESVLAFQQLRLGYGSQPPLYAWLQWLVFSLFGVNLLALSVLKNLLLFGTCLGMFFAARVLVGVYGAIIAAASLVLLPPIGWEAQLDQTHSVLATCMAALALWCYVGLLGDGGMLRHALFGLLIGLGLQSKYNFAVFALALMAGSLLVPEHRRAVWNRKAWIGLALLVLSLAPHGLWLFDHLELATRATRAKMLGPEAGYASNVARGFSSMAGASLLFATPLGIVYGWIWWRHRDQAQARFDHAHARFFLWYGLAAYACITALVLAGALGSMKPRWLQPVLFLLPLASLAIYPALAQPAVCRRVLRAAAVCAIVILAGLSARAYLGKNTRAPYAELTAQLVQRFPHTRTLVAGGLRDAGNLYLHNPAWRVLLLPEVVQGRPAIGGEVLLIDSVQPAGGTSAWLQKFLRAYPSSVLLQRGRLAVGRPEDLHGAMAVDYALVALGEE
jgi:4-amino-4-deoxy-L-arabinose transferase-like glycosyltransferase